MELANRTPFAAELVVLPGRDGQDVLVTVLKCTYALDKKGRLEPAAPQIPVLHADAFHGEPDASSVKWESDVAPFKPGTDVVLLGQAYAPDRRKAELHVGLKVGRLQQVLAIFGDRHWRRGLGMSAPAPFECMPLTYERAFGGVDRSAPDARHHEVEPRNPVGRGFRARRSERPLGEVLLPNIEDPKHLIRSPDDRPAPAGFGFTARQWMPRRGLAGTYDEAWRKKRAPLLPTDFDDRHYNAAHPALIVSPHLSGKEPVDLIHLSPRGPLHFLLPGKHVSAFVSIARKRHELRLLFDTLVLLPDEDRVVMIWRGQLPLKGDMMHHLEWVEVVSA
jgi:hypothetical protein